MFAGYDRTIFEILGGIGAVGRDRLDAAWREHAAAAQPLARILLERGDLSRAALLRAVASALGAEFVATPPAPGREVASLIPPELGRRLQAVALGAEGDALVVAAVDPFAPDATDELGFRLGRAVRSAVTDPERVRELVERAYGDAPAAEVPALAEAPREEISAADLARMAAQAPVIRFVNQALERAVRLRAADLHFEPHEGELHVRCRVDGALVEFNSPPRGFVLPVTSRLKVLAGLDIAERRLPQDGRIKLAIDGRPVDLRVSTLPTLFGESVVLRVLDQAKAALELAQLGLPGEAERELRRALAQPHGMVLVTGPTGSGKTTTLYGCLRTLDATAAKILTIEDPVEYEVDGIVQVNVNPAAGLDFSRALRAFLRQDPDVVMVGEIRDPETARIAVQAALTGHLVLSTLHTGDTCGTIARLTDLGVEPFLLASTLSCAVAQRLVRRICPACREPAERITAAFGEAAAGQTEDARSWRGRGCAQCGGSGYAGRLGLFEFLRIDSRLRELICGGAVPTRLRQSALAGGLVTLRAAGLRAVLAGETTAEEVLRHT